MIKLSIELCIFLFWLQCKHKISKVFPDLSKQPKLIESYAWLILEKLTPICWVLRPLSSFQTYAAKFNKTLSCETVLPISLVFETILTFGLFAIMHFPSFQYILLKQWNQRSMWYGVISKFTKSIWLKQVLTFTM